MKADLIYDVGSHNGDDTAYYLYRGFRVVAVEANPLLAAHTERRFAKEIAGGRLGVLNVGIAEREEVSPFWINAQNDTWSSFDRELGCRDGTKCHETAIPTLPFSRILAERGVPWYLKVDIEGSDALCTDSLDRRDLPKYISLEVTHTDDVLMRLHNTGYRRFKLVNQGTYTESTPVFANETAIRILRKACTKLPPLGYVIRRLPVFLKPQKHDFDDFVEGFQYTFLEGCSGPFGEETYGRWHTLDETLKRLSRIRQEFVKGGIVLGHCWYDVHATY